jgi:hypothetical protein
MVKAPVSGVRVRVTWGEHHVTLGKIAHEMRLGRRERPMNVVRSFDSTALLEAGRGPSGRARIVRAFLVLHCRAGGADGRRC